MSLIHSYDIEHLFEVVRFNAHVSNGKNILMNTFTLITKISDGFIKNIVKILRIETWTQFLINTNLIKFTNDDFLRKWLLIRMLIKLSLSNVFLFI